MKTDIDIKTDIYRVLKGSELANVIDGGIFRNGRPDGRNVEDIVIQIPDNTNGQIQEVFVTVNIYVPDIYNNDESRYIIDETRMNELALMVVPMFDNISFDAGFRTELDKQVVLSEDAIHQHFIYNRILYQNCNE